MDPIFLLILALSVVTTAGTAFWKKFESGQIQIDPLKHPLLHRAQRIIYANNTAARELEFQKSQTLMLESVSKGIEEIDTQVAEITKQRSSAHLESSKDWTKEFHDLNRTEEKRRTADAKRLQDEQAAKESKRRQEEIAAFTKAEVERQKALPITQREIEHRQKANRDWYQRRRNTEENDEGYSTRKISVHAVNIRQKASPNSKMIGRLDLNQKVTVSHWTTGEVLYGNNVWFKIEGVPGLTSSGWIWSGAVDKQTTSGLQRLNTDIEPDVTTLRNARGDVILKYEQPLSMDEQLFIRDMDWYQASLHNKILRNKF